MKQYHVHVLSNTHWDREWYMSHEKYLVRLVSLMDRLMDIMKKDPDFIFICDGQFSMVDDYLTVRPEKAEELKGYVKEGRLEVGPWFTQPLETLVSGEAMIRNLHYGIAGSEQLGRAMRFSYEVDEFGHASQTPQILRGFGIEGALAWRGVPFNCRSAFEWASPDGTSVTMLNTNGGYGEATALPLSAEDFTETIDYCTIPRAGLEHRVKALMDLRLPRADSSHLLWLNGIDHAFVQPDLPAVLAKINETYPELEVRQSTCEDYFESVRQDLLEKGIAMPREEGELMYTAEQILESTHSCHPRQKQKHYITERYLERQLEPTAALAMLAGFDPRAWAQERAWKYVLENHAHDTLGCTSVDEIYEQAMARYGCALSLAEQVAEDCRRDVMSRFADEPSVTVFNNASFPLQGAFPMALELPAGYGNESFILQDEDGNEIPFTLLEKAPGSDVRFNPKQGHPTVTAAVNLKALVELPTIAPFGWKQLRIVPNNVPKPLPTRRRFHYSPTPGVLENEQLRCVIHPNGTVDLTDKVTGCTYPSQFLFEDNGDVDNLYVHITPLENKTVYSLGAQANISLLYDTPQGAAYEIALTMQIPEGAEGKDRRCAHQTELPITLRLFLGKGARHLRAEVTVDNRAREHRLRVLFPTLLSEATVSRGGQPFDVVERAIRNDTEVSFPCEQPYPTHPMQDICDVSGERNGLTVAAEGIYEYECIDTENRTLALTLLRCIDAIDKNWSFRNTESENLATVTYQLALFPHGADWREVYGTAIADLTGPVFALNRAPEESVMTDYVAAPRTLPATGASVSLTGENLMITTVKKSFDSDHLTVRVLNYGTEETAGTLALTFPGTAVSTAYETDLNERRLREIPLTNGAIPFTLRKAGLITFEIVFTQN